MDYTKSYYTLAYSFQQVRARIMREYEMTMNYIAKSKGTQFYEEEAKAARDKRDKELAQAIESHREGIIRVIDGMEQALSKRELVPPTEEQWRIVQYLKMKGKVTRQDLNRAANTLADSPLCLDILQELAEANNIPENYRAKSKDMTDDAAQRVINSLRMETEDFLRYDTTRAARLAEKYSAQHGYITEHQPDKRPLFDSVESCFSIIAGMDETELKKFSEAVEV